MYKLINVNIVLYFQTANMQYTIKNFQKIYLAPLSYMPPSPLSPPLECLKSKSTPGGLIENLLQCLISELPTAFLSGALPL